MFDTLDRAFKAQFFDPTGLFLPARTTLRCYSTAKLTSGDRYPCGFDILAPGGFNPTSIVTIMLNSTKSRLLAADYKDVASA